MPKENDNREIWSYFKRGDIVRDADNSIWGKTLFKINSFHGNSYCPLVTAHFLGKKKSNGNMCNLELGDIKLISAEKRPLRKLTKIILLKLLKKGSVEAKREFKMRVNTKSF